MKQLILCWFLIGVLLPGAGRAAAADPEPPTLTLMTHDSFSVGKDLIAEFESAHRVKLRFVKAGDAGAVLTQAILSRNNPLADVLFGVDNTFLSRALQADIFEPYAAPALKDIPEALQLDATQRLLPVDFGDVCLNVDRRWFTAHQLEPPKDLTDLTQPAYKGLTVVENPATSSPGLAFLLATIGRFGDPGFLDYWKRLKANDVLVADGWKQAYWGHFSAASKGDRPIVVSYAGSPAAEVHYAEKKPAEARTAAVVDGANGFRQIEFVGILKGTAQRRLAEQLVDFLLSRRFQEDLPLQMFMFPANRTATLPEVFVKHTRVTETPVQVAPAMIEKNREQWIQAWTETVLR